MSIHIPEEQDSAWHVTPPWTCSIPTYREGTSRPQCSFDKNSLQDSWCGLVIPPLTALLLAWQKHFLTFLLPNYRSLQKDPQEQQLYFQETAQLTKKNQNQNPNPRRESNQEWLPVYFQRPIMCANQAIAAKLMNHIWRELANNFMNSNQQKDSVGLFLLECPAQTLLPAWAHQFLLK